MLRLTIAALSLCVLQGAGADERQFTPDSYFTEGLRARELLNRKEYGAALELIRKLNQYYSDNSFTWTAAAAAADEIGRVDEAIEAARRALDLGAVDERYIWFEVAKAYAKRDERDHLFEALQRALDERFTPRTRIRDEPAFRAFVDDAKFRSIAGLLPARSFSRDEGWRYDLAFVTDEARRLHASFAREAFSDEFAAAAKALHDQIPKLSDAQIRVRLQQLLTLLHDGHTGIDIDHQTHRLPLRLYFFADGVFVIDAADPHKDLIGSRVVRIGARSVEELLASLPSYVPRDNAMGIKWRGPHTLVHMDFLQALGAIDSTGQATVAVKKGNVQERVVELSAVPAADPEVVALRTSRSMQTSAPLYLQPAATPYWMKRLTAETLYFHFSNVWDAKQQSIKDFATALHRELDDGVTRNLIVDVRLNSGGDLGLYPPILQALSAFRISDAQHEIYCITGRNTFSAAQAFIGDLERFVRPVFAGEPSSSSPNFVGESTGWFELPYSGTRVSISERHHQHATLPDDGRSWIAPLIPVQLTSDDYFANRDPTLDAVLRAIDSRAESP